ncbi:MAG: phosphoribosylaminoimidazolesuccinocarboxamide synthase, partial [Candidatus Nomurabacteria bacterium]|nr:phosphoribosylaminoimidazolesuccinocarboxamide synthase [Candidatus Nomurabacteria bacterium]
MSIAKIGTGKVRDIFRIKVADGQELVAFITSDRISAFDHIFEQELVGKGAILAEVSQFFAEDTASIVPNYLIPRDKISQ